MGGSDLRADMAVLIQGQARDGLDDLLLRSGEAVPTPPLRRLVPGRHAAVADRVGDAQVRRDRRTAVTQRYGVVVNHCGQRVRRGKIAINRLPASVADPTVPVAYRHAQPPRVVAGPPRATPGADEPFGPPVHDRAARLAQHGAVERGGPLPREHQIFGSVVHVARARSIGGQRFPAQRAQVATHGPDDGRHLRQVLADRALRRAGHRGPTRPGTRRQPARCWVRSLWPIVRRGGIAPGYFVGRLNSLTYHVVVEPDIWTCGAH
jgi:hypothetical protein